MHWPAARPACVKRTRFVSVTMAAVALREPGRTSNVPVQVNVTGGAASTDWQKKAVLAAPGALAGLGPCNPSTKASHSKLEILTYGSNERLCFLMKFFKLSVTVAKTKLSTGV